MYALPFNPNAQLHLYDKQFCTAEVIPFDNITTVNRSGVYAIAKFVPPGNALAGMRVDCVSYAGRFLQIGYIGKAEKQTIGDRHVDHEYYYDFVRFGAEVALIVPTDHPMLITSTETHLIARYKPTLNTVGK